MTYEERIAINERIDKLIGSQEDLNKQVENMELVDKINTRDKYRKMREKLFKIAEKNGEKALILTVIQEGRTSHGVTANGKHFEWYGNHGCELRSRYCGRLYIEGVGTVFTSGTIAKAFEYILNN
jgi:hypothetical protein